VNEKIGFLALMLGGAGMDGPNKLIPALLVLIGLAVIGLSVLKEKGLAPRRPKQWTRPAKIYYIVIVTRGIGARNG